MAVEVGRVGDYDSAYVLLSNLEHSNARSANDYVIEGPEGYDIDVEPGANYVRETLLTAHHLLMLTAKLADEVLGLGVGPELRAAERKERVISGLFS